MAKKIIISIKILFLFGYNYIYPSIGSVISKDDIFFYAFILALFLPEAACIFSKSFLAWVKEEVRGQLVAAFAADVMIKISAIQIMSNIFRGTCIETYVITLTVLAGFGAYGLGIIRAWLGVKEK